MLDFSFPQNYIMFLASAETWGSGVEKVWFSSEGKMKREGGFGYLLLCCLEACSIIWCEDWRFNLFN